MLRILKEPLVHFLLLGAGLFLLFGLVGGSGEEEEQAESYVKAGCRVASGSTSRSVSGQTKLRIICDNYNA